jgi:restriction system protein
MLPVLRASKNGEVRIGEVVESLADQFALSSQQRAHLLPSGKQSTFANRVHWAKSYLGKADLIESTKRGHFKITDRGSDLLLNPPQKINIAFLQQYPEFQAFKSSTSLGQLVDQDDIPPAALTPDEDMRRAHTQR